MWKQRRWFCIDTETTGLDPSTDRIVQVGGVWYQHGRVLKVARDLINPEIPIPPSATRIHGITNTIVEDSPTLEQVAPEFLHGVAQAEILIGYNWRFDDDFLWESLGDAWGRVCHHKLIIDVLVLAQRTLTQLSRHRLTDVAQALGLPRGGLAHEAAADAIMTCHVLHRLLPMLPNNVAMVATLGHELAAEQAVRAAERAIRSSLAKPKEGEAGRSV